MKQFLNMTTGGALFIAIILLLAGGCISAGPDYIRPQLPAQTNWSTALSAGVAAALAKVLNVPFVLNMPTIFIAALFSAAIGVIFGFVPARKAARLDPIEVLRHE